jgi:hypothetical protein
MDELPWSYRNEKGPGSLINVLSTRHYQYQSGNMRGVPELKFKSGSNKAVYDTIQFNAGTP